MKIAPNAIAAAATLALAGAAMAQTPLPITNGSFETPGLFGPLEPLGWHNLSNINAVRRTVGDGRQPALGLPGSGGLTVRTGEACIELGTGGNGGFVAFTTDVLNFDTFNYYNPAIDWTRGDVVVTGWYMIPANFPVDGETKGIKLELRLPSSQIAWSWEATGLPTTTNDQWVRFEYRLTRQEMQDRFDQGVADGFYPPNPVPNQMSLLPFRFIGDNTPTSGKIFWDDIVVVQEDSGPSCPACAADYDQSGGVDGDDITAFFNDWQAGAPCGDVDGSGGVDGDDIPFFFDRWQAGGCN